MASLGTVTVKLDQKVVSTGRYTEQRCDLNLMWRDIPACTIRGIPSHSAGSCSTHSSRNEASWITIQKNHVNIWDVYRRMRRNVYVYLQLRPKVNVQNTTMVIYVILAQQIILCTQLPELFQTFCHLTLGESNSIKDPLDSYGYMIIPIREHGCRTM